MGILDLLLKEITSNDLTQQIREICAQIAEEEKDNTEHKECILKGPNIFLCLEVPGRRANEVAVLTLEREYEEIYVVALWTWTKNQIEFFKDDDLPTPKKQKTWIIQEYKAKKILTEYAKIVKTLRGE